MPKPKRPLRRGEIIGEVVSPKPTTEADCFIRCPSCGGPVDVRGLAQVIDHAGPLRIRRRIGRSSQQKLKAETYRSLAAGSMMVFDEPSGAACIPGGV